MNNETVTMPTELTAENGGKGLMIGEFFEEIEIRCQECADCENEDCYICDGTGFYMQKVPIEWSTIKAIYKKAVDHFGK